MSTKMMTQIIAEYFKIRPTNQHGAIEGFSQIKTDADHPAEERQHQQGCITVAGIINRN